MIPKGRQEYRRIGLVEVVWKVVAAILHLWLTGSTTYHDFLHGFRAGRGTGTATLKAKLIQQLARRLLRAYWGKMTMMARAGGYYGDALKGNQGVTQGNLLSPKIVNVVVDAVVRHWVTMALEEAKKRGEKGKGGRHQAALFYADDGMLALSDPCWLQWEFNALVSLFERVGLRTNVGKAVSMV